MSKLYRQEKDAIALLGLLSIAYRKFDFQYNHPDGQISHQTGLNIFACIVDNCDGEILAQRQNNIHEHNNPMYHAEQLSLADAINEVNRKRPRNYSTTSVETYYRSFLFNDPKQGDYLSVGGTLYTTLEPCPFCASALLVTRMKRVVYIMPDLVYGGAYPILKEKYYAKYDTRYELLAFEDPEKSKIIEFAANLLVRIKANVEEIKKQHPNVYETLLLDYMPPLLKDTYEFFVLITSNELVTSGSELAANKKTLNHFKILLGV